MSTPICNCKSLKILECNHFSKILSHFNNLRQDKELCDISIMVDGKCFYAHKNILQSVSPYFKVMFTTDFREKHHSELVLRETSAIVIETILEFIYSNKLNITESNVEGLLQIGHLFQLQSVQDECASFLSKRIETHNCLGIKTFLDLYNLDSRQVKQFIQRFFQKVIFEEEFVLIPLEQLTDIISSDGICVFSEEIMFQAAMKWIRYDITNRQKHLYDVLKHIRFSLMSPAYIVKIYKTEKMIKDVPECRDLLDEAKDYLLLHDKGGNINLDPNLKRRNNNFTSPFLYVVGGCTRNGIVSSVEKFDGYVWSYCASMNIERTCLGTAVIDGYLYALGGYSKSNYLNSVERYSPKTNTWYTDVAPMMIERASFGVAVDTATQKLYVVGGHNNKTAFSSLECYSAKDNKWTTLRSMDEPRFGLTAAFLNGYLFALGGMNVCSETLDLVERYDVERDFWDVRCPMLRKRKYFGVVTDQNYLYAIGGLVDDVISLEKYDPSTNMWAMFKVGMNKPRIGHGVAIMRNQFFVVGGADNISIHSSIETLHTDAAKVKDLLVPIDEIYNQQSYIMYHGNIYPVRKGYDIPDLLRMAGYTQINSYCVKFWDYGQSLNEPRLGLGCNVLDISEGLDNQTDILASLEIDNLQINAKEDRDMSKESSLENLINGDCMSDNCEKENDMNNYTDSDSPIDIKLSFKPYFNVKSPQKILMEKYRQLEEHDDQ